MADHLRLAKTNDAPRRELGAFVMTETARDIHRSLDLVSQIGGAAMTMVAGVPGTGKSEAIKAYAEMNAKRCIYIQAVRGEGTPWNFAHSLGEYWGYSKPVFRTVQEARMKFAQYIGPDKLLLVDESQYLHQKNRRTGMTGEAIEWLRGVSDTAGFQVALCGDLNLLSAVASMPQLQSRMRRPGVIEGVNPKDVVALTAGTGFEGREAVNALVAVSGLKGGLRNVENVIRLASLFAGHDTPQLPHLKAAILDMKLAPKGGAK